MSYSSLWVMDENYNGFKYVKYNNSWLFSPVVWDVLLNKYMYDEIQTPYEYKKSLIGIGGEELEKPLNTIINNCDSIADRICWELSNQQVFFTKNKEFISQGIKDFVKNNNSYEVTSKWKSSFTNKHIIERFNKIADDILKIDEERFPYFIFKNTSVDDNVEYWFRNYNEENDEYERRPLSKLNKYVTEFVVIGDGQIKEFISNLDYFKNKE